MEPLLHINQLSVSFQRPGATLDAVRCVDFIVEKGAICCLVGESGCGKSLTCKSVLRLTPENAVISGQIYFDGENLAALPEASLRKVRGARIGMIFQEPMTSLNPVLTVGEQTAEPLRLHLKMKRGEAKKEVVRLFSQVGISSPESRFSAYPHQLSGGMRQRVMIAMALACGPELLLADEPTTALDATVQGQILRLLVKESQERGMAVLLITHDLGVVADLADTVGVMYAGSLVEFSPAAELFENPLHPYTQGLMNCAPGMANVGEARLPIIPGTVPSLSEMPEGCPFQPRCGKRMPVCLMKMPIESQFAQHRVACWLYA